MIVDTLHPADVVPEAKTRFIPPQTISRERPMFAAPMIASRADYAEFLQADLRANHLDRWRFYYRWKYPILSWQRSLRRAEYYTNCSRTPLGRAVGKALRLRTRMRGMKLGFTIPTNVFGPGLCVPHWGTIVVNDRARVGANCRIHPGTCIGEVYGGTPVAGDNVYIGPGAKLYGGIVLGDNVRIGANAVVGRSFPEGNVTLVGAPARPIGATAPARMEFQI